MQYINRFSACRRQLNTSSAALPRGTVTAAPNEHGLPYSADASNVVLHLGSDGKATKKSEPVGKADAAFYLAPPYPRAALNGVGSVLGGAAIRLAAHRGNKSAPQRRRTPNAALPNPSLKLSTNGVPPGPRDRAAYHRPRGPGVTPSVPA